MRCRWRRWALLRKRAHGQRGRATLHYLFPFLLSLLTLILIGAATHVATLPSDGVAWVFPEGRISEVDPGSPGERAGLQPGDVVLAVGGQPLGRGPLYASHRSGQSVVLTIRRGSTVQDLALELAAPPLADLFWRLIPVAVAFSFWSTGVVLFVLRPKVPVCGAFFGVGQGAAVVLAMGQLSAVNVAWAIHLFHVAQLALPPLLANLYVTLAALHGRTARRILRLSISLSAVIALPELAACLLPETKHDITLFSQTWPVWCLISRIYTGLALLTLGLALVYTYFATPSEDLCRRLRGLAFGTVAGFLPLVLLSLLPELLWGAGIGVPYQASFLFLTLIPLSYAYVIAKHDLTPLDRLFNRSLVVFALGLMWVALYLGGVGVGMVLLKDTPLLQPVVGALATMVLAAVFTPLREWVQRLVDRLFYGGWYDYRTVITQVSRTLSEVTSRGELAKRLMEVIVKELRVKGVALYLWEAEGKLTLEGKLGMEAAECLPGEKVMAWLSSVPSSAPVRFGEKNGQDLPWASPLIHEGKCVGMLLLSEKQHDDFFEPMDEGILRTLGEQAGLATANVFLLDNLRQAVAGMEKAQRQLLTAREEERRILAWELHDGPVQDLLALSYQLSECRDRAWLHEPTLAETLEEVRRETSRVSAVIREACTQLRSDVLDIMGLGPAMKQYAYDLMQRTGIVVYLDVPDYGPRLADPLGITLLRVFQESLNNAAEHAGVGEVWTSFRLEDGRYELRIWDNGRGFALPDRLEALALRGHFGLVIMEERVAAAKGHLSVRSAPGEGTWIRVWGQVEGTAYTDELRHNEEVAS